jgi:uncharacterized membrane-anchored protein
MFRLGIAVTVRGQLERKETPMICHHLVRYVLTCAALLSVLTVTPPVSAQSPKGEEQVRRELAALAWQRGPTEGRIGGLATIKVPQGQLFLDAPNTRRFLELNGNPPRDNRYALVAEDLSWFAVFFFEETGYVKDDEKLDPEALLKSLQEAEGPGNKERKRLGMSPLYTEGWHVRPHYDLGTRRLEWGVRLRTESGESVVNYSIRLLSRRGVMHVIIVSDPEHLNQDIGAFKASLTSYSFVSGERYSEFRSGDRVAEYGLGALVLGGAAAVAVKSGAGKGLFKMVVYGAIAIGGGLLAFLRKLTRRD